MELTAEENNGKTILNSEDKHHTVMNLVREYLWQTGAEAGYEKGHPYVGASSLVINADSPADAISEAVSQAKESLNDLRDALQE